ncbi:MAG TPA: urease accessory protein UreD [Polyangiaceae bacterium]|nr:urease accessory protein UreD [Polyangiaceae bacterium]
MTAGPGWLGRLSLELDKTERGTQLTRSSHEGPLRIQRVLTPEGPECPHIYLLHPPGGVVGGDRLQTRVTLRADAQVLLTTPAAQKLYRAPSARAEISNELQLGEGARLEWLPSETLAFSAAQAEISTRVELAANAAFVGWDIICYGMPARGESFDAGRVVSRFEISRAETPLVIEALDLASGEGLLSGAFALRGQPVVASLFAVPAAGAVAEDLVERVREATGACAVGPCSVSSLGEVLVVRALGQNVESVRAPLIAAWQLLRPAILARDAVVPRIWAT